MKPSYFLCLNCGGLSFTSYQKKSWQRLNWKDSLTRSNSYFLKDHKIPSVLCVGHCQFSKLLIEFCCDIWFVQENPWRLTCQGGFRYFSIRQLSVSVFVVKWHPRDSEQHFKARRIFKISTWHHISKQKGHIQILQYSSKLVWQQDILECFSTLFTTASSEAPQIPLCRRMLGSNPENIGVCRNRTQETTDQFWSPQCIYKN